MHAAELPTENVADKGGPWWRGTTRYHWFVFAVAALGWLFDTMDQQFFALSRAPAIKDLLGPAPFKFTDVSLKKLRESGVPEELLSKLQPLKDKQFGTSEQLTHELGTFLAKDEFDRFQGQLLNQAHQVEEWDNHGKLWQGLTTMIFMIGWATGGIIFGIMGDRIGRVKTMVMTILFYSIFTGLSAFAPNVWWFSFIRFLTGLGVGGQFAVGVALVAEVMPDHARTRALGWLQALSAFGNMTAAVISIVLGNLAASGAIQQKPWKIMFLIGVLPALLIVVVMRRLHEPERWKAAVSEGEKAIHKPGSFAEFFGNPTWRHNAIVGLLLASAGVIGLWGIGFFYPELTRIAFRKYFAAPALGLSAAEIEGKLTLWTGIASLLLNAGGFFGVYCFSRFTSHTGRKPAFALAFVLAAASTAFTFWFLNEFWHVFVMIPIMGFCLLSLFGGYAIYFPELFPTRLRSTGISFCYNVGRYVASAGPLTLGMLSSKVFGGYGENSIRYAGVSMCVVFLIGLIALPFAPETKGKPLPE